MRQSEATASTARPAAAPTSSGSSPRCLSLQVATSVLRGRSRGRVCGMAAFRLASSTSCRALAKNSSGSSRRHGNTFRRPRRALVRFENASHQLRPPRDSSARLRSFCRQGVLSCRRSRETRSSHSSRRFPPSVPSMTATVMLRADLRCVPFHSEERTKSEIPCDGGQRQVRRFMTPQWFGVGRRAGRCQQEGRQRRFLRLRERSCRGRSGVSRPRSSRRLLGRFALRTGTSLSGRMRRQ